MPLVINSNPMSLNAQRNLAINTNQLGKSLEKLSSGFRINRASDDAAGMQISETLRSQIRGSKKALDNVQDGISILNIMDGAFGAITENLQRMRELAVQAANDTNATAQRNAIEAELDQLAAEITRISDSTQFNGNILMNSSMSTFNIHLGPNAVVANDVLDIVAAASTNPFDDNDAAALGTSVADAAIVVTANSAALAAITSIESALTEIHNKRSSVGAMVNRLEGAAQNLMTSIENLSSSESRIRNVDVAAESAEMIRNQILQQSSATVLAQANQGPSLALQLLKGG